MIPVPSVVLFNSSVNSPFTELNFDLKSYTFLQTIHKEPKKIQNTICIK